MSDKLLYQKNKVSIWTVLDHFRPGIIGWAIGNRSAETFVWLWQGITDTNLRFSSRGAKHLL